MVLYVLHTSSLTSTTATSGSTTRDFLSRLALVGGAASVTITERC